MELDPGRDGRFRDVVDQGPGQPLPRVQVDGPLAAVADGRRQVGVVPVPVPVEQELLPASERPSLGPGVLDPEAHQAELAKGGAAPEPLTDRSGPAVHRPDHELELPITNRVAEPGGPRILPAPLPEVAGHGQQQEDHGRPQHPPPTPPPWRGGPAVQLDPAATGPPGRRTSHPHTSRPGGLGTAPPPSRPAGLWTAPGPPRPAGLPSRVGDPGNQGSGSIAPGAPPMGTVGLWGPAATGTSMRRTSRAVGRRTGSLSRRASRTGPSGPARAGWPGGSARMAARVAAGWPRSNGAAPSTANHRVAPSAHRSAAGPAGRPVACSGATYGSDPNTAVGSRPPAGAPGPPVPASPFLIPATPSPPPGPAAPATPLRVRWVSSWREAMPKSASLTRPSGATITLAGLTSWWTIPAAWAASSASTSCSPARAAAAGSSGPDRSTSSRRVGAGTSSMTRNRRPSASTTSWMVTNPGWLSRAAARASRSARSRSTPGATPAPEGSSTSLTATGRPSRASSARHTVPIPPRPSGPRGHSGPRPAGGRRSLP